MSSHHHHRLHLRVSAQHPQDVPTLTGLGMQVDFNAESHIRDLKPLDHFAAVQGLVDPVQILSGAGEKILAKVVRNTENRDRHGSSRSKLIEGKQLSLYL